MQQYWVTTLQNCTLIEDIPRVMQSMPFIRLEDTNEVSADQAILCPSRIRYMLFDVHWALIWITWTKSMTSHPVSSFKIHFNIILQSTLIKLIARGGFLILKLIITHLVKKLPSFYGENNGNPTLGPILASWVIATPYFYFFKMNFIIFLTYTLRAPKPFLRFNEISLVL
jgi:hypothetical protein